MADQIVTEGASQVEQAPVDPWAAAFAALDKENEEAAEAGADAGEGGEQPGDLGDSEDADGSEGAPAPEGLDGDGSPDMPGGPGDLGGEDGGAYEAFDWSDIDVSEEGVKRYRDELMEDINSRTIRDVAATYIQRGARHTNGLLGASINDPDVCKRDRDGVPRFYNPETGREFTGDNPRRQAQEWVDSYNRVLKDQFNQTCKGYSARLLEQERPRLAVVEFAPTYNTLDPMRRLMFESIIQDYEVRDSDGDIIGYSCDLNKALAAVNRQVTNMQRRYGQQAKPPVAESKPTGPVLDTPSVGNGGAVDSQRPEFHSVAEAMEYLQNQQLEQARQKGSRR